MIFKASAPYKQNYFFASVISTSVSQAPSIWLLLNSVGCCFENSYINMVTIRPVLKWTRSAAQHSTYFILLTSLPLVCIVLLFQSAFCWNFLFNPFSAIFPHWYLFGFKLLTLGYGHRRKDQQVVCTNRPEVC